MRGAGGMAGGALHQQQLPPPPPLPKISACERHPDLPVTGFCASCLRERLQVLDPHPNPCSSSSSLRRCKSFSFARDPPLPSSFEPQRRSCDVRSRSTLSSLFHHHSAVPDVSASLNLETNPSPRRMKDHIDLDAPSRRPGSFWLAASVFSKKLQNWRRRQKLKKQQQNHPQHQHRHRQEGRRSCDTDPRFSLDAARISLDLPPRASWDGHIPLARPSVFPRLLSVVEDSAVPRSDGLIPVEEDPGGTLQTREYYADTSQRRRRSLDRSGSVRKPPVLLEEECRSVSNARVSNYDCSNDSFDYRECSSFPRSLPPKKPTRRWWSLWGLIQRRGRGDGDERSGSDPWTDARRNSVDGRSVRGNASVGRHSFSGIAGMGSGRRNCAGLEVNCQVRKKREEFPAMERNRSMRYSPGRLDNGMLRFYLTPMWSGSRRAGTGVGRINGSSSSIARSVLRLY